jgi:hypothetical protein
MSGPRVVGLTAFHRAPWARSTRHGPAPTVIDYDVPNVSAARTEGPSSGPVTRPRFVSPPILSPFFVAA